MLHLLRIFTLLGLFGGAVSFAESSPKQVKWVRGLYVAESPMPRPVPEAIALSVASAKARAVGGSAIRGNGNSMQPLYQDGVIMIVAPVPFADLKRGQTVVYENRMGNKVAHVLVTKLKKGWRVAGLNNPLHDGQGVNERNLRGVVVEAYHPVAGQQVVSR